MSDNMKFVVSAEDKATQILKGVQGQVNSLSDAVTKNQSKISTRATSNEKIFSNMGKYGAIATTALIGLGTASVLQASKLQDLRIELDTLTGSAKKGGEMFLKIQKMAASTPFESTDITKATSTMLQFGISQGEVLKNMKMLGDISGGNADKLQSLALVFGQVSSAGKLQGQDLLQLINLGFNPLKTMSDRTGKSMSKLKDEMSKGKITFEMVRKEMELATSKGGLFFGMMDKKSQTFSGVMSTLKDNVGITLAALGGFSNGEVVKGGLLDSLTKMMTALMPKLEAITDWANKNPEMAKNIFLSVTAFAGLITVLGGIGLILPKVILGFKMLSLALTTNPIMLTLTAIIGLMAGIKALSDSMPTYSEKMASYNLEIKNLNEEYKKGTISQDDYAKKLKGIQDEMKATEDNAKTFGGYMRNEFASTLDQMAHPIDATVEAFRSFGIIVNAVGDGLERLMGKIITGVGTALEQYVNFMSDITDSIGSTLGSWIIITANALRNLWTSIGSIFIGIKNTMVDSINSAVNLVKNAITSLADGVRSIRSNIIGEAFNRGRNLINMVADGVESSIGALTAKIKGVAQTISDYLGFHSPTKKGPGSDADSWAPNLVKMFANGLVKEKGLLERSMGVMGNVLSDGFGQVNLDAKKTLKLLDAEFTTKLQGLTSKLKDVFSEIKQLSSDYSSSEIDERKNMATEIVAQEQKIADLKKSIREEEDSLAGQKDTTSSDYSRLKELKSDLKNEEKAYSENSALIKSMDAEVQEARRVANLTDFQKYVEDRNNRALMRLQEYNDKRTKLVEEATAVKDNITSITNEYKTMAEKVSKMVKAKTEDHIANVTNEALIVVGQTDLMIKKYKELEDQALAAARAISKSGGGAGTVSTTSSKIKKYANGGVVKSYTKAIIGDGGTEAVVPMPNGQSIPVDLKGGGGKGITINIGTVYGSDKETARNFANDIVSELQRHVLIESY